MKRVLSLILAVVLCLGLCACSTGSGGGNDGGAAKDNRMQEIINKGEITVGCVLTFAPVGYIDENGDPQGFDVELARLLADSLGVELNIVEVTSDERIPSLETDKVDVVIGNFTRTLARAQKVMFTDPYIVAGYMMLARADSGYQVPEDAGKDRIAVVKGSSADELCMKLFPDCDMSYVETSSDGLVAVKNGQADAFIEDSTYQLYQADMDAALVTVGGILSSLDYNAFGVKQGEYGWLQYLNQFIFTLNADGTVDRLYQQFLGSSMPDVLNPTFPVSAD